MPMRDRGDGSYDMGGGIFRPDPDSGYGAFFAEAAAEGLTPGEYRDLLVLRANLDTMTPTEYEELAAYKEMQEAEQEARAATGQGERAQALERWQRASNRADRLRALNGPVEGVA